MHDWQKLKKTHRGSHMYIQRVRMTKNKNKALLENTTLATSYYMP